MNSSISLTITSVPDIEVARSIARSCVEARLAACVQILPKIESIYFWEGVIKNDFEILLIFKTSSTVNQILSKKIKELHPYDTPEILCINCDAADSKYSKWLFNFVDGQL